MVTDKLDEKIYALVRRHNGKGVFKEQELRPETDLDADLNLSEDEARSLMDEFFNEFNVSRANFTLATYYPPEPPLLTILNPLRRKRCVPEVPDFAISMLIESARAGRWLYE
ncbi:DUF1493 family protein [Pantoea stewartii]|uniref:DUF1493 family protein n=1 Tax=Pantoea stewartii TaxID=66269 RepID=UPI00249D9618|nr:DUF1493 family protein [Pantoea stewartii]